MKSNHEKGENHNNSTSPLKSCYLTKNTH